ncbi:MAG TPA: hypothetical protein VN829_21870 [Dongiaceae bacterium]|nr:hypothetical protein [Dongiaceae bacterium]
MIDAGHVRLRKKGVSKRFRDEYGHTPLSAKQDIPCDRMTDAEIVERLTSNNGRTVVAPVLFRPL